MIFFFIICLADVRGLKSATQTLLLKPSLTSLNSRVCLSSSSLFQSLFYFYFLSKQIYRSTAAEMLCKCCIKLTEAETRTKNLPSSSPGDVLQMWWPLLGYDIDLLINIKQTWAFYQCCSSLCRERWFVAQTAPKTNILWMNWYPLLPVLIKIYSFGGEESELLSH